MSSQSLSPVSDPDWSNPKRQKTALPFIDPNRDRKENSCRKVGGKTIITEG